MRNSLLCICLLLNSLSSIAQCDAIQLVDWNFNNDSVVDIMIIAPEGAMSYNIDFLKQYESWDIFPGPPLSFDGSLIPGENILTFDLSPAYNNSFAPYFFGVDLSCTCTDQSISAINHFYVSRHSLLSDPGFEEGDYYFSPATYLADDLGYPFITTFVIPPDSIAQEIDSISVLIDIGHSYNGDLSIQLTNPVGTTISLLDFPSNFGGSSGFSVLFKDGTPPILSASSPPQGTYAPSEALEAFVGTQKSGIWTVTVYDNLGIDYGYLYGVGLYFNTTPCLSSLSGEVYYDFDSNGVQGITEPNYGPTAIFNSIDSDIFYNQFGGFYLDCSSLGQGSLQATNPPLYYEAFPSSIDLNLVEGDYLEGLDFAFQPSQFIIDLELDLFSLVPDRPGFDNIYYVQYENIGTVCAYDVSVSVELDPSLELTGFSNPDIVTTGSGVELLLDSLCPTQSGTFELYITADSSLAIGDTLFTSVSTSDILDETATDNNSETLESIVIGSYDPNDKLVDQSEIDVSFLAEGKLEYMIRFQNTGNYYAERVVVTDLLPEELDMGTLSVMASSHDFVLSNSGSLLYFTFDDIFLPDNTTDPIGSNGFVRFEISPNEDLVVGDIISNGAKIYFDYNAAIITNDALTEVVSPVGLEEIEDLELSLFPNPAHEFLTLTWDSSKPLDRWQITDALGKICAQGSLLDEASKVKLDISNLANGTYTLGIIGKTGRGSQLFTKQ